MRRRGQIVHTGKHDYDDGMYVGRNASRKRTMRQIKRRQRRESVAWMMEE